MTLHHTNLRDAHLHLAAHGEELAAVPLADCTSVEECLARVSARAAETRPDAWVVARGARIEAWEERRYPSAAELRDAAHDRPVLVASFDHHAGSGSSAALAAAGISRDAPDSLGSFVHRDSVTTEPTGVVLEAAFKALCHAMPRPSHQDVARHILAAQEDLLELGFAEVHDMMTTGLGARVLRELEDARELEFDVLCFATADQFEEVRAILAEPRADSLVRFGGLKIFTDGTLNSRTAHMLNPYAEPLPDHPCGTPLMTRDEIDAAFARAHQDHFDIAAHAIGDGAVRTLLDAYEAASVLNDGDPGFELRIEHAQFIDEADVPRFAALDVIASLQPCHLLTDVEATRRLTPDRPDRAFPLRDLIDEAARAGHDPADLIYLGSDTPVVPPTPADNIQGAVHRRRADPACPALGPGQAISEAEAWSLMQSTTR